MAKGGLGKARAANSCPVPSALLCKNNLPSISEHAGMWSRPSEELLLMVLVWDVLRVSLCPCHTELGAVCQLLWGKAWSQMPSIRFRA